MGIDDRDYMRDSKGKPHGSTRDDVIPLSALLVVLGKVVVVFLALIICIRLPFIWFKLAAAIAVFWLGWRWISAGIKGLPSSSSETAIVDKSSSSSTRDEVSQSRQTKIERYEAAVERAAGLDQNAVRLLVAYDAAGEFGKAKTLIQRLDGEVFPEAVAKELAVLAGNYFPVKLETTEAGVCFKLA